MSKKTSSKVDAAKAGDVRASSGNVFADLGAANPEESLAKAELARQIGQLIEQGQMTQAQAGEVLGIDQPKVSALLRGKLESFSAVRLIRFLNALGQDVEIVVRPRSKRPTRAHRSLRVVARKQVA
jgi:predicted XRE-type DNA-binding protein